MKDIPIAFINDETIYESENYVNFKLEEKDKEIKRLNNIIKEVREYIEKHIAIFKGGDMLVDMNIDELLEILDKVEENSK